METAHRIAAERECDEQQPTQTTQRGRKRAGSRWWWYGTDQVGGTYLDGR